MTKLALVHFSGEQDWETSFLLRVKNELSERGQAFGFELVENAEEADVVFYVDSSKSTRDLSVYKKLLEWACDKGKFIFTLSFEDRPLGVFPGIYTSLETRNFDSVLHLSWPHLETPNDDVESSSIKSPETAPWLFSFAGSRSHRFRKKLFSIYSGSNKKWKVNEVKRWYNHTKDEEKQYVKDILDSRFVLCPRGIACYSHRILETIILERIPVIIADDWVPFSIPEQNYYVTIPEKELGNIAEHLERELENCDLYRANLLNVKSNWLTQETRYCKVIKLSLIHI